MNIRARIIVKGKVQAGGYRYIIEEAAYTHHLTGRVWNQDDGTVQLICEGQKRDIQQFQESIWLDDFMVQVRNMEVKFLPATGEFEYFDRIPDLDPSRATLERADAAARALRALDTHLSGKLDTGFGAVSSGIRTMDSHITSMDSHITSMDSHITSMDSHITAMDSHIGRRFDRLDQSYGKFGKTLKTVSKDMNGLRSFGAGMASDMKGMRSSMSSVASDTRALRKAATPARRRPRKRAAASV